MNYEQRLNCTVILATCTSLFSRCEGNHVNVKKSAPELFLIAINRGRFAEVFCANFRRKNCMSSSTMHSRYFRFLKNECLPRFSWVNLSVRVLIIFSVVIIVVCRMQLRESFRCFSFASKHHELFDDKNASLFIYAVMLLSKCRIHLIVR